MNIIVLFEQQQTARKMRHRSLDLSFSRTLILFFFLQVKDGLDYGALADLAPADQAPVLVDLATESDFLADLGAHGTVELQLGQVHLDGGDASARAQRANVQHENLALGQLLHLGGLLVALGAHAQQATQQERADLNVRVDLGQRVDGAERVANHTIGTTQLRIDLGTHTFVEANKQNYIEIIKKPANTREYYFVLNTLF